MSVLKWIKENVFDWSSEMPVYRGYRPPKGWNNIQRAKKRANKASRRTGRKAAAKNDNK